MTKFLFFTGSLLFASQAFSSWTQKTSCVIERTSVDDQITVQDKIETQFKVAGPHNGESGKVNINSELIPSYNVVLDMFSGGRTDELELTTYDTEEKVVSKSSVDLMQSKNISNRFVTKYADYQITVTCELTGTTF